MSGEIGTDPVKGTEDEDTNKIQCVRSNHVSDLRDMYELRIVLLGSPGLEKSKIGNTILGREAFKTRSKEGPALVKDQCERAEGQVKGRSVAVISTPDLLDPQLSDRELFYQIERCVSLAAPGPHVFLLVLQKFTEESKNKLKSILRSFSDEAFEFSMVLVPHKEKKSIQKGLVDKIIHKCGGRCHVINFTTDKTDCTQVTELMEKIDLMVKKNGTYLDCEIYKEPESAVAGVQKGVLLWDEQKMEMEQKPHTLHEQQKMGNEEKVSVGNRLNVVLCGRTGAGKTSAGNTILGLMEPSADPSSSSVCVKRQGVMCGCLVTVVELPALYNTQLSEKEVMRETHHCISLCDPGVHAFLLVAPLGPLTDEDRGEMQKIKEILGTKLTDFIMMLYFTEHMNTVVPSADSDKHLCGGRYHVLSSRDTKSHSQVPELLENIQKMTTETEYSCYTPDMYFETQVETLIKYQTELEEIKKSKEGVKSASMDLREEAECLRIVLLGKTGVGKSATGNTILGTEAFYQESSPVSVTLVCQKATAEVHGRKITVVDTPGLFDTAVPNEEIKKEIIKCVSMAAPGPHVFLLVLPVGRFTEEERGAVKMIQDAFGDKAGMYTIVLFTRGHDLGKTSIEEYIQKDQTLNYIVQTCGKQLHAFNNKERHDSTQVTDLLEKIDAMVAANGGSCYTNEMFQEVEETLRAEQQRILKEREEEIKREKEELMKKHNKEMEDMKRQMAEKEEEQERERQKREKDISEREKQMQRLIEDRAKREEEERVRREEEYSRRKGEDEKQREKWMREIEAERKKQQEEWESRMKKEQVEREKEARKREEKHKQEMQLWEKKQKREREEFEREKEKIKAQEREKQEKRKQVDMKKKEEEENMRKEWEEKIRNAEESKRKELKELQEKQREEWERRREEEQRRREEEDRIWKQKEEIREKIWQEKQRREQEYFENKMKEEIQKRESKEKKWKNRLEEEKKKRDKEAAEKLHQKDMEMKRQQEEWEKQMKEKERREREEALKRQRKEHKKEREREDKKRKEEEQKKIKKLKEEHEKEKDDLRKKCEEKARKQAEEEFTAKLDAVYAKGKKEGQNEVEITRTIPGILVDFILIPKRNYNYFKNK